METGKYKITPADGGLEHWILHAHTKAHAWHKFVYQRFVSGAVSRTDYIVVKLPTKQEVK